jgi:hypothetical protein
LIVSPPRLIAAMPVVAHSSRPLSSSAQALVRNVLPLPAAPRSAENGWRSAARCSSGVRVSAAGGSSNGSGGSSSTRAGARF